MQTGQRTDSIGQTILQTVAQKAKSETKWSKKYRTVVNASRLLCENVFFSLLYDFLAVASSHSIWQINFLLCLSHSPTATVRATQRPIRTRRSWNKQVTLQHCLVTDARLHSRIPLRTVLYPVTYIYDKLYSPYKPNIEFKKACDQ